jgi:hypothetical protein
MSLGDFFSAKTKSAIGGALITRGSVLKCFTDQTNPPKYKRFIVLGQSADSSFWGVVLINTNVNFNVINSQELLDAQHLLLKADNTFLEHNSYADCSTIFRLPTGNVNAQVGDEPHRVLGEVAEQDLQTVIAMLKACPNVIPKTLLQLGL